MTNREKAEAAWGVPLPDWIEKLATACDGKGLRKTAADLSVSPAIASLAIRRNRAKLDFIERRVKDILGLPRARAYQPERLPGQPAKALFIHQPHRSAAFPLLPRDLPVQRNRQGGTP